LAEFLRYHREATIPGAVGLRANGPRRTPGLRREEVSQLAGVGLHRRAGVEPRRRRVLGEPSQAPDGVPNVLTSSA